MARAIVEAEPAFEAARSGARENLPGRVDQGHAVGMYAPVESKLSDATEVHERDFGKVH